MQHNIDVTDNERDLTVTDSNIFEHVTHKDKFSKGVWTAVAAVAAADHDTFNPFQHADNMKQNIAILKPPRQIYPILTIPHIRPLVPVSQTNQIPRSIPAQNVLAF